MSESFLQSYLPYVLRRADLVLSKAFYRTLSERGVQRSDWRVLAVLHEGDAMTMREVTATALSPQPTVSHSIARLESKGLVERVQSNTDRRVRLVRLTNEGHDLARSLVNDARRHEQNVLDTTAVDDLAPIVAVLTDLCKQLDRQTDRQIDSQVEQTT